jgi:hypothetical protein
MSSEKTSKKTVKSTSNNVVQKSNEKVKLIQTKDFDISKWSFQDIDLKNERNQKAKQYCAYGRYNYGKESSPDVGQLVFNTGPIKLVTYGIPSLGEYAKTDEDRCYIKIPCDPEQQSCVDLFKMFRDLDEWVDKNKDSFFKDELAKLKDKYVYSPIVKVPEDTDDGKKKLEYAKFKLSVDWDTKNVDTQLYVREDGKPVHKKVKTVTDVAQFVTWNSVINCGVACNKLWFSKSADAKTKTRTFGVSFKILQCEVVERSQTGSAKQIYKNYMFGGGEQVEVKEDSVSESDSESEDSSSDSDSDNDDTKNTKNTKNTKDTTNTKNTKDTKNTKEVKEVKQVDTKNKKDNDSVKSKSDNSESESNNSESDSSADDSSDSDSDSDSDSKKKNVKKQVPVKKQVAKKV